MVTKIITIFFIFFIFALGVLSGAYYHHELSVLSGLPLSSYSSGQDYSEKSPIMQVLPGSEASILDLPNMNEPLPLVYSDTLEENKIQEYLKQGAVVLPLGPFFGEPGNVVVTAHSSGTLSFGPYRQAFARLSELEEGQEFSITTPEGTYVYRVYGKEIVWPHEVDKLPDDDRSTVTLVTCWPLWTNFKRLLVHSELIEVKESTEPIVSNG